MAGYAYGIITDKWKLKDTAYPVLYRMIKNHPDIHLCEMVENYYLTNKDEYQYEDDLESFFDFTEWFENEQLNSGIEAVIVELINELEFHSKYIFEFDDCAIYVRPYIPENRDKCKDYPVRDEIRHIFAKYVNPLLKEPVTIDWIIVDLD